MLSLFLSWFGANLCCFKRLYCVCLKLKCSLFFQTLYSLLQTTLLCLRKAEVWLTFSDDFRVFCGDLGNEVTDEILTRTFAKYPSLLKAKVVRDKKTNKSKGYGFLSFKDPNDFAKAMREMNGKSKYCNL